MRVRVAGQVAPRWCREFGVFPRGHRELRSGLVFFRKRHLDTWKSGVFGGPQNHRLLFSAGSESAARRCSPVTLNNIHWGAGLLSLPALG